MLSTLRSRLFLLGCLFSVVPMLSATSYSQTKSGATAKPATDDVTQLDTLVVTAKTELPPPEDWHTTKIHGFDVFSNASERATKKLLKDFEEFQIALDAAWPIKAKIRRPATLIFCARNSFAQFITKTDKPDSAAETGRASTTLIGPEHAFIVVDLGTSTLSLAGGDIDMDMSFGGATFEVDYYRLLYREYVHYLLSQTDAPPPPWYEEGILQIIQNMEVDPKGIRIGEIKSRGASSKPPKTGSGGMPSPTSTEGDGEDSENAGDDSMGMPGSETIPDTDFNVALQRRALLGFKEFFGVTRDSPLARNPIGNNIWAKQCYAFVHMCLYGIPNKHKKSLETFLARSAKEPVTEELFTECFGKTYKKILSELRGYIDYTAHQYNDFKVQGKDRITMPVRELTTASESDSARMKADALLLANNAVAAIPTLRGAYGRGAREPDFLASYGLAAHAGNQTELARRMLAQAVAAKTTRAAAYPAYAQILLDDARANPDAGDGKHITPEQLTPVLEQLFAARQFRPALRQTYETIASAWMECSVAPKPENFSVLTEGLSLFPRDPGLVYQSARVAARMKNAMAANALIAHGLKISPDEPTREKFNQLKQTLQ